MQNICLVCIVLLNFHINSLLDVLAIKECNTTGVKCGNCDERTKQSHYCFQCYAFWCEECINLHSRIKANKDHYALALEDFQDQDFENILKRPEFCAMPGHEKKEIEFFCKICEVAICNACALTDHDGHGKILLELAANERKLKVAYGTLRNETKRNGTLRNGTLRNGTLRNGTLRNGTLRNGTLRNGYTSANAPKFFALATKS